MSVMRSTHRPEKTDIADPRISGSDKSPRKDNPMTTTRTQRSFPQGRSLLRDDRFNRGTACTAEERSGEVRLY
jgi:hypothetical protein